MPDDITARSRQGYAAWMPRMPLSFSGWPARLGLTLWGGVLATLATPAVGDMGWLAWVAFAPWLLALAAAGAREGAWLGSLFGLLYSVPGKWSTIAEAARETGFPHGFEPLATALVFLPAILPFALVGGLLPLWRRWPGVADPVPPAATAAALTLAILAFEFVLPYTPAVLIADQVILIQAADLGGVPLICFVLLYANALFAALVRARFQPRARTQRILLTGMLLFAALACYGQYRLSSYQKAAAAGDGARLSVLAVQTDTPMAAGMGMFLRDAPGGRTSAVELTRRGLERYPSCEVIAWPESPRASEPERQGLDPVCRRMAQLTTSFGHPVLLNCTDRLASGGFANEARLLGTDGDWMGVHRKARLVPAYEDRRGLFGLFGTLGEGWSPGAGPTVFESNGHRIVPTLCFEIHDPELIRNAVLRGGQTIVHMASFAAFGRSHGISSWDLAMARLRAIEVRRPLVRVANRGHTGLILATGEIGPEGMAPPFGRSARCLESFAPHDKTLFLHWGEGPFRALLVIMLAMPLLSRLWWRYQTRRN